MFFAITWDFSCGCISETFSSSPRVSRKINGTLTWYTSYCNNTSCLPALINPSSFNNEFLFAGTSWLKPQYRQTRTGSRSSEAGLPQRLSMKFNNLSACEFYKQFVEGFQAVAAALTAMRRADVKRERTAVHQAAFDKMKQAMISATHLSANDPRQTYHPYTDTSKDCVDATLALRCTHGRYTGDLRPVAFLSRKMQSAATQYPIGEQELFAILLALKQRIHLLRGPQQVHVHTNHQSLRYLKMCPRPLTPQQARRSQFLKDYNLTLWYVPCLEDPSADACSRLMFRQLMDIENATGTGLFVVPLVKNVVSPEGEPVEEFQHVLEDVFSDDKV